VRGEREVREGCQALPTAVSPRPPNGGARARGGGNEGAMRLT
jgi:hypothetical protein